MFIDLISTNNLGCYNIKAAKILGLETAVYLNELINIYNKAFLKQKLDEQGFFRLKRSYIVDRTNISSKRQLELDLDLMAIEIISKSDVDPDLIKVDIEMYASILTNQNLNIENKIEKLVTKKSKAEKEADKRFAIRDNLKRSLHCTNIELRKAYCDWIDSIYDKPNGFLSKSAIKIFEDSINNYTKGDLDVALELLKIATIKAYNNAEWVINIYDKQQKNSLRTTKNRINEDVELSNIQY